MCPRPFRLRKINNLPVISGLKPYGKKGQEKVETVFLQLEEYEALRLCDYEMLNHHQASILMAVSRPTLTRIYSRARQKIAEALVEGKQLIIEGGKVYFDSDWYSCTTCGCYFNNPDKQEEITNCPLCGGSDFSAYEPPEERFSEVYSKECQDVCLCLSCGYEITHFPGHPCKDEICPRCGKNMVRK